MTATTGITKSQVRITIEPQTLPMDPAVSCIVLNWNRGRDTATCLQALRRLSKPSLTVLVVDNGSTDDSLCVIRSAHPEVELIQTGHNFGFAGGNNVGIRHALNGGAGYIWLLNNDTEPQAGALEAMLAVAETDSSIGAVGSVLRYSQRPHEVQSWGGGHINLWSGYNSVAHSPRPSDWFDYLCAGSMLVRREALLDVGLLDENYFLFWEDADFSFRLRRKGWKLAVASDAIVLHKENASTIGNSPVRDRYSTASCLRFLRAWSPIPRLASQIFLSNRLAKRMLSGQFRRVGAVLKGVRDARALSRTRTEKA